MRRLIWLIFTECVHIVPAETEMYDQVPVRSPVLILSTAQLIINGQDRQEWSSVRTTFSRRQIFAKVLVNLANLAD